MAIFNLFSKRQKALRGEVPDVYKYDDLSNTLRVQIVHIWTDTLGNSHDYYNTYRHAESVKSAYKFIVDTLCREYGLFKLPTADKYNDRMYLDELANYLLQVEEIEKQLDIVELSFKYIDKITRDYSYLGRNNASECANNAINELNSRFKEQGVGFQFLEGEIVRVDSELIHVEAVKPALRLLNEKNYKGAQQEFLSAYEHYRHGKHKESLNDCLKSFESTMKGICDKRKWSYLSNATAKVLIQICFDKGLVPQFWQQQLSSLRSMLESSVPTGRNKLSGHGQGSTPTVVPDYLVAYMLHMTASTLVFLTTAEKELV
ncbi:STM4504/CBY_0614 family protein [Sulfuricurvum sp.]|uniref:STM4504/CBY_0614 family protein n=1 Tax=Sulfuricurvum sp. TaxID=2025608 RepID=UPI003567F2E1